MLSRRFGTEEAHWAQTRSYLDAVLRATTSHGTDGMLLVPSQEEAAPTDVGHRSGAKSSTCITVGATHRKEADLKSRNRERARAGRPNPRSASSARPSGRPGLHLAVLAHALSLP